MTSINPLTGAILQSTQVQRQQSIERDQLLRRTQAKSRSAAPPSDDKTDQVENAEAISAIHQDDSSKRQPKQHQHQQDEDEQQPTEDDAPPHIDVTG